MANIKLSTADGFQLTGLQDRLRNYHALPFNDGVLKGFGNQLQINATNAQITIDTGAIVIGSTLCVSETTIAEVPLRTTAPVYIKGRVNLSTGVADIYQSTTSTLVTQDLIQIPTGTREILIATIPYPIATSPTIVNPAVIDTVGSTITSKILTVTNTAQMKKITDDNGYISKNNTSQTMNAFFTSLPVGLHTISVTGTATGVPLSGATPSIYGQAMKYAPNDASNPFGKVWCFITDALSNASYSGSFSGTGTITASSWRDLSANATVVLPLNADLEDEFEDLTKFPYGTTPFVAQRNNLTLDAIEAYVFNGYPLATGIYFVGTVTKVIGSSSIYVSMTDTGGNEFTKYRGATSWSGWKTGTYAYIYTPLTTAIPVAGYTETLVGQNFVLSDPGTVRFIFTTGDIVEIPLKHAFLNVPVYFTQTSSTAIQRRSITLTGGNNWTIGSATAIQGTAFATTIKRVELIFN